MEEQLYDIVGDVHGYADKLRQLLEQMGYEQQKGVYSHPSRKVIFVGDWIDRGPQVRETLSLVRAMIDGGLALAVMGNHEYNAIAFHLENPTGGHVRPHTIKNIHQHYQTLYQFKDYTDEWQDYVSWFLTIPLYLDLPSIRVAHASWDDSHIALLDQLLPNGRLTPSLVQKAAIKNTPFWKAVEETLKGKEARLPHNQFFRDKDGILRHESRIRWWTNHSDSTTYADYFFDAPAAIASLPVDYDLYPTGVTLDETSKPLFFGHYWLQGQPCLGSPRAACVDFSIAKGGFLAAYRWQGENELTNEHLVWV
ncbi:metallophosphoesterase [Larkinella humicola]|uniref:Phosphoesterase n=1 Tax=Larkinella humicola TaxID=2607654 RepID=A0A5N1JFV7_9BACT|nr:metallophosphoesterase [Larkinella humicola]KAA9353166.1 phosphoesterase [Larkinella humicola]